MPRDGSATRIAVLALGLVCACPLAVFAGPTKSISPFLSPSFDRTIHGDARDIDLSRMGRNLGHAEAFLGVDSQSTATQQYLTSGLQWRSDAGDTPLLRASALRTEGEGASLGRGQTLMRVENRLDLGGRWYMPDLSTEVAQVSNKAANGDVVAGRAARVGLTRSLGAGEMTLGYFQADPQFDALGSAIVAGDRGMEVQSSQRLGERWQMSHAVRLHQPSALRSESAVAQTLVLSRRSQLTDLGRPWQFRAQLGAPIDTRASDSTPLALEIASQTLRWRDWRLDSSLGWYDASMDAPLALPVDGTLWQVSASRGLNIGGLAAEFSPTFAFGGSRYDQRGNATRTGLNLGLSQLSDRVDLSVNYLSAGWAAAPRAQNDLQMTVNFTQKTGAIMPGLRSMAQSLRLPWRRRR
jgi:hypothetical protein